MSPWPISGLPRENSIVTKGVLGIGDKGCIGGGSITILFYLVPGSVIKHFSEKLFFIFLLFG